MIKYENGHFNCIKINHLFNNHRTSYQVLD